jgi:NAD(P)-dependent dehydrogenase (short-subunit alcohol dehydrogenase family)
MKIRDSVAFVTGANRGIGLEFARELVAAGARKVYGRQEIRNPSTSLESSGCCWM